MGLPDPPFRKRTSIVETLTETTPTSKKRASLFEDNPLNGSHIPGALHLASDEHIERLIVRQGAVNLVRQLAEDLARRDAQLNMVRRRADDRERILRRMLLDCDVRSIYIDEQLRQQMSYDLHVSHHNRKHSEANDTKRKSLGSDSINDMMNQAMNDPVAGEEGDLDSLGFDADLENFGTIRAKDNAQKGRPKSASKGWKEFFLGGPGKKSKASSVADSVEETDGSANRATSKKPLQKDLFTPLVQTSNEATLRALTANSKLKSAETSEEEGTEPLSKKTSNTSYSVAGWASKLLAGAQTGKDDNRGRDVSSGPGTRASSTASKNTTGRAAAKLSTVRAAGASSRRSTQSGPNGALKGTAATVTSISTNDGAGDSHANLGPVEMDTILPPDSRPPSLTPAYSIYYPSEFATDRFGFIYDQKRRKRQKEAAAASDSAGKAEMLRSSSMHSDALDESEESDSRPMTPASTNEDRKWHHFLKLSTGPAELLSHTPAPQVTTVVVEAKTPPKSPAIQVGDSLTITPSTATSAVSNAIADPNSSSSSLTKIKSTPTLPSESAFNAAEGTDSVKQLLEQVTELHDNLQKEKTIRWNEFLRKVRAERQREGEAATSEGRVDYLPEAALMDGEMIGVAGLGNKGKVGRAKWNEFKALVLGGIPVVYRPKIWAECAGAAALRIPGYYEDLLNRDDHDPLVVSQIAMDINRTLTDNIFFRKGPGVEKLKEVLLAYAQRNPEVGYCQGMNMIAGALLLIMPTAEDAFWVMVTLIETILPKHYYDHSLLTSRADQRVLRSYVSTILPNLSDHLDKLGIELEALTFQWFLSVFTDCLSAEALFRVWDVIFCTIDGSTFLFQVALALLKLNEKALLDCESPASIYTYINHNMTNHAISIDGLIRASEALRRDVRRADVEERRERAVELELEEMKARSERKLLMQLERQQRKRRESEGVSAEAISIATTSLSGDNASSIEVVDVASVQERED
jgi:hypothetical protein